MENNVQTFHSVEIVSRKEISTKKLLNILDVFIFGGLALTNVTNPLPSIEEMKEFLLCIAGIAIIYYFLVNIYVIGGLWRVFFYATLVLLSCFILFMAFYLSVNSIPH